MTAYYNEIDPFAAQWLRNLIAAGHIAPGEVDERSICDVKPDELRGFTQHHYFAGIGSVPYRAIKLKRKAVGIELSPSYFLDAVKWCETMEREMAVPTLFDLLGAAAE